MAPALLPPRIRLQFVERRYRRRRRCGVAAAAATATLRSTSFQILGDRRARFFRIATTTTRDNCENGERTNGTACAALLRYANHDDGDQTSLYTPHRRKFVDPSDLPTRFRYDPFRTSSHSLHRRRPFAVNY